MILAHFYTPADVVSSLNLPWSCKGQPSAYSPRLYGWGIFFQE